MAALISALRVAATAMTLVVGLTACFSENAPNDGTITIDNQSSTRIGWVVDVSGRPVEEILAGDVTAKPVAAGVTGSLRSLGTENSDWCEPDAVVHFLVAGIEFDPVWESATVPGRSVDVLTTLGPGRCWGQRDATLVFDG